ncbi:ABC transporter substrate-binding protein [Nocardioides marmoriginsengisoli]|nr:ABC transporter substrate-binding protein [Nocardioides marmoriginsengisoli]
MAAVAGLCCLLLATACTTDGSGTSDSKPDGGDSGPGIAESFDSRFTGNEEFCRPAADAPDEAPKATAPGITADEVVIANIRLKIEDLEKVGFAFDNGDQADQAQVFVDYINDKCGGINGRKLKLETIAQPVPGFGGDPEVEAQQTCTKVADELHAVVAFSYSGVGNPLASCLSGPKKTGFVTTYDLGKRDFAQADGRLFSVNHSPENILKYAALEMVDELKGKKVGVVYGDQDPNGQVVQEGLVATLEDEGVDVARVDALGCADGKCTEGLIPSVQGMRSDKVDVVFPLLDTINLPTYLREMVTQGFKPGDVQFVNSSFMAQDSELVTGKMVEFGGKEAGELYDGATIWSGSRAGEHRIDGFEPDPFVAMCNETYAANSTKVTKPYDQYEDEDNRRASSVASHCAGVRMLARAIEAAGANPTREDIYEVLGNFGKFDHGEGLPASFRPGKPTGPDAVVREKFSFPCKLKVSNAVGHCIEPVSDFLPLPD